MRLYVGKDEQKVKIIILFRTTVVQFNKHAVRTHEYPGMFQHIYDVRYIILDRNKS